MKLWRYTYSYTGLLLNLESPVACFSTHLANLVLCGYQWHLYTISLVEIKGKSSLLGCKRGYQLWPIITALVIGCVDDLNYLGEWKKINPFKPQGNIAGIQAHNMDTVYDFSSCQTGNRAYLLTVGIFFPIDLGCWHEQCSGINQAENGVWCDVLGRFLDNCHNWHMQQANGK